MTKDVRIKRAYSGAANVDGARILVDRIWPRGVSKEDLRLTDWIKEIAPSDELRKWFDHDPERWDFALNWPPHSPGRVIANDLTDSLNLHLFGHCTDKIVRHAIAEEDGRSIYAFSTGSPLRSTTGASEDLALFAGQISGAIEHVASAATIMRRMLSEAEDTLAALTKSEELLHEFG